MKNFFYVIAIPIVLFANSFVMTFAAWLATQPHDWAVLTVFILGIVILFLDFLFVRWEVKHFKSLINQLSKEVKK